MVRLLTSQACVDRPSGMVPGNFLFSSSTLTTLVYFKKKKKNSRFYEMHTYMNGYGGLTLHHVSPYLWIDRLRMNYIVFFGILCPIHQEKQKPSLPWRLKQKFQKQNHMLQSKKKKWKSRFWSHVKIQLWGLREKQTETVSSKLRGRLSSLYLVRDWYCWWRWWMGG